MGLKHIDAIKKTKGAVLSAVVDLKENNKSSWRKEKYIDTDGTDLYEGTECFEQKVVFQTDKVSVDTKVEFTILDFYPLISHTKS